MIESKLILEILHATLEGEKYITQIQAQLPFLTESEYEHTGSGLIMYLEPSSKIAKHRLSEEQQSEMFGEKSQELTKFELINETQKIKAEATVHFSSGILDSIELWNSIGKFPEDELKTYTLSRL